MPDPLNVLLPTSNVWDPSQIYETEGLSEPLEELLIRMYQNLNQMALAINLKESAYYTLEEFVNNQQFFSPMGTDQTDFRDAFRVTVNFGALPAAGAKSVAHGIGPSSSYTATRIIAAATKPSTVNWIPIPYVSATAMADNLQLDVDATKVTITTGGTDYSLYTQCIVVIEYIKN